VIFSDSGRLVTTVGDDSLVRLWDAASDNKIAGFRLERVVRSIAFSAVEKALWHGRTGLSYDGNEVTATGTLRPILRRASKKRSPRRQLLQAISLHRKSIFASSRTLRGENRQTSSTSAKTQLLFLSSFIRSIEPVLGGSCGQRTKTAETSSP
jgi:hypothetical protein